MEGITGGGYPGNGVEQTWPATMMVARFVEIVKEMTLDASVVGAA